MSHPLRIAVIGVGHLGQHHARLLAGLEGVELAGVVDIDAARAQEIAAKYGARTFADPRDLIAHADAVTIATPTVTHADIAMPFVEAGIAVLVEKPLAAGMAEADRLLDAAARSGAIVATGHTERFNPAVATALPLVTRPRFVEIHRLGTFPERSLDIDVIFDLMIHDLDLLLTVAGSDIASIDAVGVNVLTPRVDIANARIRFASGCVANVTASRISRDRVRKARFFSHDAYVSVDYAAQEVEVYRLINQNGGRPVIRGGPVEVASDEPLRRELADFAEAVRSKRPAGVTGHDGRAALALATQVADLIAQQSQ
jgi:predicted dehydrogenase